jgi:hypothetical protein
MKNINYLGYKISRIERCGHRRVGIWKDNFVLDILDGYDMVELVKEAKSKIRKLILKKLPNLVNENKTSSI